MHMIGYLGGDSDTYAVRRSIGGEIQLVIEFPDTRQMLVFNVHANGDIGLDLTAAGDLRVDELLKIGRLDFADADGTRLQLDTVLRDVIAAPDALVLREVTNRVEHSKPAT